MRWKSIWHTEQEKNNSDVNIQSQLEWKKKKNKFALPPSKLPSSFLCLVGDSLQWQQAPPPPLFSPSKGYDSIREPGCCLLAVRHEEERIISCDLSPLFPGLFVSCVYSAYLRGSICHRPRETRDPEDTESLYPEEPPSTGGGGERQRGELMTSTSLSKWRDVFTVILTR